MLYKVIEWLKSNGEVKAMERLRMKVLPACLKEKVFLAKVKPDTSCSPALLKLVRDTATDIVGKPCPV